MRWGTSCETRARARSRSRASTTLASAPGASSSAAFSRATAGRAAARGCGGRRSPSPSSWRHSQPCSSPPGRAVLDEIREAVGVERAQPALFSLPAPGRLLVASDAGVWVVQQDGSKRLLGAYREASWSPFGRFVVAARENELAALEPDGSVRWTLARPGVRFPRWAGTETDTRIAYVDRTGIRVVAGDGTDDQPDRAGRGRTARLAARRAPRACVHDREARARGGTGEWSTPVAGATPAGARHGRRVVIERKAPARPLAAPLARLRRRAGGSSTRRTRLKDGRTSTPHSGRERPRSLSHASTGRRAARTSSAGAHSPTQPESSATSSGRPLGAG